MTFHLFIDESGELGRKARSSEFFIITALCTEHPKALNKRLKKIKAKLYNDGWPKSVEIKGTSVWGANHNPSIPKAISDRRKQVLVQILNEICASPISVHYSVVNKQHLSEHLLRAPYGIAYNFLCGSLLCRAYGKHFPGPLDIVVDQRSKETHSKTKFDGYLETRLIGDCEHTDIIKIEHLESDKSHGLQAVDFLSWSLFRNYEFRDPEFRDILARHVGYRDDWYSWKK